MSEVGGTEDPNPLSWSMIQLSKLLNAYKVDVEFLLLNPPLVKTDTNLKVLY